MKVFKNKETFDEWAKGFLVRPIWYPTNYLKANLFLLFICYPFGVSHYGSYGYWKWSIPAVLIIGWIIGTNIAAIATGIIGEYWKHRLRKAMADLDEIERRIKAARGHDDKARGK